MSRFKLWLDEECSTRINCPDWAITESLHESGPVLGVHTVALGMPRAFAFASIVLGKEQAL